eukprot:ANDGO_01407.mRNA.1 hypothetical protein
MISPLPAEEFSDDDRSEDDSKLDGEDGEGEDVGKSDSKDLSRRACAPCRQSHKKCVCDSLPCPRCIRMGIASQCVYGEPKKRGRPRKVIESEGFLLSNGAVPDSSFSAAASASASASECNTTDVSSALNRKRDWYSQFLQVGHHSDPFAADPAAASAWAPHSARAMQLAADSCAMPPQSTRPRPMPRQEPPAGRTSSSIGGGGGMSMNESQQSGGAVNWEHSISSTGLALQLPDSLDDIYTPSGLEMRVGNLRHEASYLAHTMEMEAPVVPFSNMFPTPSTLDTSGIVYGGDVSTATSYATQGAMQGITSSVLNTAAPSSQPYVSSTPTTAAMTMTAPVSMPAATNATLASSFPCISGHSNFLPADPMASMSSLGLLASANADSHTPSFVDLYQSAPVGQAIWCLWGFLHVNSALCECLQYSQEELLSGRIFWPQLFPQREALLRRTSCLAFAFSGDDVHIENPGLFVRRDGTEIPCIFAVRAIRDAHRQPVYFVGQIIPLHLPSKTDHLPQIHSEIISMLKQQLLLQTMAASSQNPPFQYQEQRS